MNIKSISNEQYSLLCKKSKYFYNSAEFHLLNQEKVEFVYYFLFYNKKNKFALAAGVRDGELRIPYSAPFGMFEVLQSHIRIEDIEEALTLLENFCKEHGLSRIFFRFPPMFYDREILSKMENVLWRRNYLIVSVDLNYHFDFSDHKDYLFLLRRNAKKNLKQSLKYDYCFEKCESEYAKQLAYDVIRRNRSRKGYPLRMTYQQVYDTIQLTNSDFFLLYLEEIAVASAIVFCVNSYIYQVIYWGDIDGYEDKRPMNRLAYHIYDYYKKKGIQILDIGPSTEDGIPNYGLCDYKESIGCEVESKKTYVKNLIRKE